MPHISIPEGLPGIRGPLTLRPDVAKPLSGLMEVLMRQENSLSRGVRELIATYVSYLNDCRFCELAHGGVARHYLQCDYGFIYQVKSDPESTTLPEKIKALLGIAASVQRGGQHVNTFQIERAKEAGASDIEIHDTVLIAAAFSMLNRYTDGLATWTPTDINFYLDRAPEIAQKGYVID